MKKIQGKNIADSLFVIQIVGAVLFCGAQFLRSLTDVHGVNVSQFTLVATYLTLHLALGIAAHRAAPSRVTRQAVATYAIWFIMMLAIVIAVWTNADYHWSIHDTTTMMIAGAMTILVLVVGSFYRLSLVDPAIKALLAIAYKSAPQVLLAWKIMAEGGSGIPAVSVVVGHLTILIRLGQIWFMVRESGLDRNRTWLAISETANEVSWIVATIAWLVV